MKDVMFGGSLNRTPQTVMEAELGLLASRVSCACLLVLDFHGFTERGTAENFS